MATSLTQFIREKVKSRTVQELIYDVMPTNILLMFTTWSQTYKDQLVPKMQYNL